MTMKYQLHNQLTGLSEQADTFDDAKILQARIRAEYIASLEQLFTITVLVQNEDQSWTQSMVDEQGNPIPPPSEEE